MSNEIERRTTVSDATIEYRDMGNGEKKPVISGYAAVFNAESRNLGGFVETIHPNAFDEVLAEGPDVIGVFNHDRNLLLGRTGNGSMKLTKGSRIARSWGRVSPSQSSETVVIRGLRTTKEVFASVKCVRSAFSRTLGRSFGLHTTRPAWL
jgi:phage head maturation protease